MNKNVELHCRFVFGRRSLRISTWTPTILTEVSCGVALLADVEMALRFYCDTFIPHAL
jgi:hypothetical protein